MTFPEIALVHKKEETDFNSDLIYKYVLLNYTLKPFGRLDSLVQTYFYPGDGDLVGPWWGPGL